MAKIDYKKELKELYAASAKQPALVEVPTLNYLRVDGIGDPNTSADARQRAGITLASRTNRRQVPFSFFAAHP